MEKSRHIRTLIKCCQLGLEINIPPPESRLLESSTPSTLSQLEKAKCVYDRKLRQRKKKDFKKDFELSKLIRNLLVQPRFDKHVGLQKR